MVKRNRKDSPDTPELAPPKGLRAVPIIGELFTIGPLIPKLMDVFRDNKGKMSSRRFGAGALVASGIALVSTGADLKSALHLYPGLGLCGLGVVLFGLTRWDGRTTDQDQPTE